MNLQRSARTPSQIRSRQRGGFVLGFIVGLLIGLALALGVALYIAKVPIPFVNKVPQRSADQEAAETQKNKNWDPNANLHGKTPVKPLTPAASAPTETSASPAPGVTITTKKDSRDARNPADILSGKNNSTATGVSANPASDALTYFVQAGAYGKSEDAEAQRGKLAMMGWSAKVTEREQSGRSVYRVRLGPFEKKEEASTVKDKLDGAGIDAALVQVQK